jgi:hypothetical protein
MREREREEGRGEGEGRWSRIGTIKAALPLSCLDWDDAFCLVTQLVQ